MLMYHTCPDEPALAHSLHQSPQGAAAKETVKLAFEKIRGLQLDLEAKCQVGAGAG